MKTTVKRTTKKSKTGARRVRFRAASGTALLGPAEIRALRERLGLTQGQLAKLLMLGDNTISRWKADRNVQTAAYDVLLRLVRDIPATIRYLRRHAA